jgi:hypothetical protein
MRDFFSSTSQSGGTGQLRTVLPVSIPSVIPSADPGCPQAAAWPSTTWQDFSTASSPDLGKRALTGPGDRAMVLAHEVSGRARTSLCKGKAERGPATKRRPRTYWPAVTLDAPPRLRPDLRHGQQTGSNPSSMRAAELVGSLDGACAQRGTPGPATLPTAIAGSMLRQRGGPAARLARRAVPQRASSSGT